MMILFAIYLIIGITFLAIAWGTDETFNDFMSFTAFMKVRYVFLVVFLWPLLFWD